LSRRDLRLLISKLEAHTKHTDMQDPQCGLVQIPQNKLDIDVVNYEVHMNFQTH